MNVINSSSHLSAHQLVPPIIPPPPLQATHLILQSHPQYSSTMAVPMLLILLLLAGAHAQSPASSPVPASYISRGPASSPGPASPVSLGPASSPGPASPVSLGPASSPGPASVTTDCPTELLNLSECLSYVSEGSNTTVPDKGCCPGLSGLIDNAPQCLCQLLGSSEVFGIPIDKKKSMELPTACNVSTPPISLCSLFGVPVSSPSPSPFSGGVPASNPSGAPSSGGSGLPQSSSPSLAPSSNQGSHGFRACNVFFFVALFFTAARLSVF